MDNIYCPIRAVIRNRTQGSLAYTHSGAASQLAVGFGGSVPLCGTYGEMGGLLCPTAALLRSLQWVSDGRSRYAEPRGEMGGLLMPHSCAASQLAVGVRWSVPLCGTYEVRWEMTASCGDAQCPEGTRLYETHCKLRSSAAVGTNELPLLPYRSPKGDVWLFVGEEVLVNRQPTLYVYIL